MQGRHQKARSGEIIKRHMGGFPLFFDKRRPRVITADPWAFLAHEAIQKLPKRHQEEANAFVAQAFDFFEAAQNPQLGSKSLLYYYSFLNLAKAAILIEGNSLHPTAHHGIRDPKANDRERLRFEGQRINLEKTKENHSAVFPELMKVLGHPMKGQRTLKVIDVLQLIPSIHRTYVAVTKRMSIFMPVSRFAVLHANGKVWARVVVRRSAGDVESVLRKLRKRRIFNKILTQVGSGEKSEWWFETETVSGAKSGRDNGILDLARKLRSLGIGCILTPQGYSYYIANVSPSQHLPCLAAFYAAMFYMGSITRYKSQDFGKIMGGKYHWIVQELLATEPTQFVYKLCSMLAGVDVVRPHATIHG